MGNTIISQKRWSGGISQYPKEHANNTIPNSFAYGRAIDYRTDPQAITLLPGTLKESGSVVIDLLKWGEVNPFTLEGYFYGNAGNLYLRSTAHVWSNIRTVSGSHGNGLTYFAGDDYLYYTTDSAIGRYGPLNNLTYVTPAFSDNFLRSQGSTPLNTFSLNLFSSLAQYATAADSASLEVTGDLTLEAFVYLNSLPAVGSAQTLVGKWNETLNRRSYKMDILGISAIFGDGSDGALTISSNTTDAPIDSACSGTINTQILTATNASFAAGQSILIHQSQGTGAGGYQRNSIQSYTAGTITLDTPLNMTYGTGAQVIVMKKYSSVTVNTGKIWTAKAWNGTTGGILAFYCSGTVTVNGTISADLCGYRGTAGARRASGSLPYTGESYPGVGVTTSITAATLAPNGGGSASRGAYANSSGGGSGAGYATVGTLGGTDPNNNQIQVATSYGGSYGTTDLTSLFFGSGASGGYNDNLQSAYVGFNGGTGGTGGGIVFIVGVSVDTTNGAITSNGGDGGNSGMTAFGAGGGGGAGGSILLYCQTAVTNTFGFAGGQGGDLGLQWVGGNGAAGRVNINYLTSSTVVNGINAIQDPTLVTTPSYQLRLGISNNGTAFEYLTQTIPKLAISVWNRFSVSWVASTSTATFYDNAVSIGTYKGTKTAISANASLLFVGATTTTVPANFLNGLIDDVRVWGNAQTASQIFTNNLIQLTGKEAGLKAYYSLNNSYLDVTANANDLTGVNAPTFSTNVPFPAPTTRLDIDQSAGITGNTYTPPTSIAESAANTLTFTPTKDPQASVAFFVNAKGTGAWTVTVHDQQNRIIAQQTITNANLPTGGAVEFIFTTPWRTVQGKTYHMHLTSTVADGTVVTGTAANFSTAQFFTYFSYLVTDTNYHPVVPFLNFIAIGNERFIAKWDGAFYDPNAIVFPPTWKVRCFGFWREYLAVGMWKGNAIQSLDKGRVYFWDGIAPTFNFFIDVPEGQINAIYGQDSDLFIFAGSRGQLLSYQGGYFYTTGNSKSNKLRKVPFLDRGDYVEISPGALTIWRGLLHFGMLSNTNSTTMENGVYSYGTLDQFYPDSLSYDYVISTGSRFHGVSTPSIGLIFPLGQDLIIGWQDGTAYGADVVNFSNPVAPSGELHTLIMDDSAMWKDKSNFSIRADVQKPLGIDHNYVNNSITFNGFVNVKLSVNRATFETVELTNDFYNSSTALYQTGQTFNKKENFQGRGNEYQIGVDIFPVLTGNGTATFNFDSPILLGISLLRDTNSDENQF